MGARDLLADLGGAGFTVSAEGGRLVIRPASKLTENTRAAVRDCRPVLLALVAGDDARADGEAARFLDRRARLLRWGWAADDAESLAERLTRRHREADARVSCTECRHYRPGKCGNHRRAGLQGADVGRDLVGLLQRCPGFAASEGAP